jgi:hypothetical protein
MINNPGIQSPGVIAWDGAAARFHDASKFVDFGFTFEVLTDLAADAIFVVQFAPASAGDPCVAGTPYDAPANAVCQAPLEPDAVATVTLPAGTVAGTVCSGTVPCRPDKFVGLRHVSGGTNVRAVLVRQGPRV